MVRYISLQQPVPVVRLCAGFFMELLTNQNITTMGIKEFFEKFLSDDETKHQFSTSEKVIYGVLVPLGFVALMFLAGWIETICKQ